MKRPITSNETESAIKLKKKKKNSQQSSGSHSFTLEFYQTFKDELALIPFKLFQKIKEKGTLPNSFFESSITLISNPKTLQKRKLQANKSEKYRCKDPQQNINKKNSTAYKKNLMP